VQRLPATAFDYMWLLETGPVAARLTTGWVLVAQGPDSRLYRKERPYRAGRLNTQP